MGDRNCVGLQMIDDTECEIADAFGVSLRFGGVKHTTFLIDSDGVVTKVYPRVKPKGHASAVLRDCRERWGPDASPYSGGDVKGPEPEGPEP